MARIVCCGEAMLELVRAGDSWELGYGGDTLNTAIHLARAGHDVVYLTALGSDDLSASLKERWAAEGLDTGMVITHPRRSTGLYAISTDAAGERSFSYWRDTSAAREMFAIPAMHEMLERAASADLFVFSLISLAILPDQGREALLALAEQVRTGGGSVAFDGNYRPRLWDSPASARHWRDRAIACADFGLPTRDDEAQLGSGDTEAIARHWQQLGCRETIVKLGVDGCRMPDGAIIAPDAALSPVDTSGAGDAFNAGYLAARMSGQTPLVAAREGHALAGWTIMRPGAIPARDG